MKRLSVIMVIALSSVVVGTPSLLRCFSCLSGKNAAVSKEDPGPSKRKSESWESDTPRIPYFNFTSNVTVNGLNYFKPFHARDFTAVPRIQWSDAKVNVFYTFTFHAPIDTTTDRLHWIVSNIPGSALKGDGNIVGYTQQMEYQPPLVGDGSPDNYEAHIYSQAHNIPKLRRPPSDWKKFLRDHHPIVLRARLFFFVRT